jgi:hypothetical protein
VRARTTGTSRRRRRKGRTKGTGTDLGRTWTVDLGHWRPIPDCRRPARSVGLSGSVRPASPPTAWRAIDRWGGRGLHRSSVSTIGRARQEAAHGPRMSGPARRSPPRTDRLPARAGSYDGSGKGLPALSPPDPSRPEAAWPRDRSGRSDLPEHQALRRPPGPWPPAANATRLVVPLRTSPLTNTQVRRLGVGTPVIAPQ